MRKHLQSARQFGSLRVCVDFLAAAVGESEKVSPVYGFLTVPFE